MKRQNLSPIQNAIAFNHRESAIASPQSQTNAIARSSAHPVEELQGAIGNRAVNQLLANQPTVQAKPMFRGLSHELVIQPKLSIGAVGDKYEQEADRIAANVVDRIHTPQSQVIQREEMPEEDEELQMQPTIQRLAIQRRGETIAVGETSTDLDTAINSVRRSGQPLDANLQQSMEQAFGADFSRVKVHTDAQSDQLNQSIQAKAFTTGQDVFFRQGAYQPGSRGGQELIAHELTHVVQQNGRAVQRSPLLPQQPAETVTSEQQPVTGVIQRVVYDDMPTMWAAVAPDIAVNDIMDIINQNPHLRRGYDDLEANLAHFNFVHQVARQPEAVMQPNVVGGNVYDINYGLRGEQQGTYADQTRYIGAILHEMMHIGAAIQYDTNAQPIGMAHVANMNLPAPIGIVPNDEWGLADNQMNDPVLGVAVQQQRMYDNWENLRAEGNLDNANGLLTNEQAAVLTGIGGRIDYAENGIAAMAHYDTVLIDILYYLVAEGLTGTRTYRYASRMMEETNGRRAAQVGAVAPLYREARWGSCYITTACIQQKGLDDNCEELMVLRRFRDTYLIDKNNGGELIQMYYKYSPMIVQRIKERDDEEEIFAGLYKIIRNCVEAIKRGDNEFAYITYCKMVVQFKEEFIPEIAVTTPSY
jgi:Domain of unknown function (DUF4157)